jgi:hypothetical protein
MNTNDKKIITFIVIIVICIVSIPFFLYLITYKLIALSPINTKISKTVETIKFIVTFGMKCGIFERHIDLDNIEKEGDWDFIIDKPSIYNSQILLNIYIIYYARECRKR